MAYFAPYVDASGLHIPTYQDVLDYLKAKMKSIYGQDIYLENDSADGQMLAIFALALYDTLQAIQLAYNNRAPLTGIGTGLDMLVKLNGLSRRVPSYSTCQLVLTGDAGTRILNGIAQDVNGYRWALPSPVTIGDGGTAMVSAQCQTIGAVTAIPGDITQIVTPTKGWVSVTNLVQAVAGLPVEQDSQLRARQSVSVELPSQTMLGGTTAALGQLTGVQRYRVFENDTGSPATDPNGLGLPGHSITCVIEGDTDANIANAIYMNRGIGCFCNGDVHVTCVDPIYGAETDIAFFRPEYVAIFATVTIKPLAGYTTATTSAIKQAIIAYLNALNIYEQVTLSGIEGAALSVMANLAKPLFSVRGVVAGKVEETQTEDDIVLEFDQVAEGLSSNVTIDVLT